MVLSFAARCETIAVWWDYEQKMSPLHEVDNAPFSTLPRSRPLALEQASDSCNSGSAPRPYCSISRPHALCPVIAINRNVLVTKVTEPVNSLVGTGAQIDFNDQIFVLQQACGACFVDTLGLTVDQQLEGAFVFACAVGGRDE